MRWSPEMDNNSNFALAEALKQAGVKLKAGLFATGYQPNVINSPAWSALQGDYFYALFRPWSLPDAGTQQMQAAMEKYDGYTKTDFPSFSEYEAWLGADLMIKGLQLAGPNPTRAGVIQALRGVKSYNGERAPSPELGLRHRLRARRREELRLDDAGRKDRLQGRLFAAVLRNGHPGDVDGERVVAATTGEPGLKRSIRDRSGGQSACPPGRSRREKARPPPA